MAKRFVESSFPFPAETVLWSADFRETLAGLSDVYGEDPGDWEEVMVDDVFQACLFAQWVFLAGRAPDPGLSAENALAALLRVTDEQFTARVQSGLSPF